MFDLIEQAFKKGAVLFASVSGGKDGQAMVRTLINNSVPVAGLIHCDLGRSEWPQSKGMCQKQADEYGLPLHILTRADGLDLLAYMQRRMKLLEGTGKPFWPSSEARYCTSDLKRGPSDNFFRKCGHGLIISAEGIRAQESKARSKKKPLSIRTSVSSKYYATKQGKKWIWMSAEEALAAYRPGKRLVLNWYPVFNMSIDEVWFTYGTSSFVLAHTRAHYKLTGRIESSWPFHPAYAMGNERVSCVFCVLGCEGDLQNGAEQHPALLQTMIGMEEESGATFKHKFSLTELV